MRILLLADIHIGAVKDIEYVYQTITDIIDCEVIQQHTDLVCILGDYFDRLFKVNEEYVTLAINVMSFLIRACRREKTKIRLVYGTESHEQNQYRLFNYHFNSTSVDIRVIDHCMEEELFGKKILYIPEEYVLDKHESYDAELYQGKEYDYIFGHGVIEDGMPAAVGASVHKTGEKQVPRWKSEEFGGCSKVCVFGHYHVHTVMQNDVYYLGSLFRSCFGEEEPKGYGIIEDDVFTFVENEKAYTYKTYEFGEDSGVYASADDILQEINRIRAENQDIFTGDATGKIRIVFHPPENTDPAFRENLRNILFHDKHITPLVKESPTEILKEAAEEVDPELDFILDRSLKIIDKMHRYIAKHYGEESSMTLEELTHYINEPLQI